MSSRARSRWSLCLLVGALTLALALALAGCGSSGGGGQQSSTWIDGTIVPKDDAGFEFMAQQRGYFKKLGIHVKFETFQGTSQLAEALLSGSVDSAELDPTAAFKADLQGANLKIIGSTIAGLTHDVFAGANIKSVRDLPGKTVAVSSPGALSDVVIRAVMSADGVSSNTIRLVSVGSDSARMEALFHGRIAATAASAQYAVTIPPGSGVHVIASSQQVIPQYPRLVLVARSAALTAKPNTAVRFLAGEMEGLGYAVAHPQAEQALTASTLHLSPTDRGIVYLDRVIMAAHAVSPTAAIPMTKLRWLIGFERRTGILSRAPDLGAIVAPSYRRRALALVGGH